MPRHSGRRSSLRRQLLAWLLVPLAALAGLNAYASHVTATDAADLVTERALVASSRIIAEQTRIEDGLMQVSVPPAAIEMFDTGDGDFVYYQVRDDAGHLLAGTSDLPEPPAGRGRRNATIAYADDYRGRRLHLVSLDQPLAGPGLTASVTVLMGVSLNSRDALVRHLWLVAFGQQLALLLLAGVSMTFGLKQGLAPLLRLRDAVRARAPARLEPFDPGTVQAEIQPLVVAINQQMSRVERQLAAQHRFVANAAHQLRTPLTVLNLQATYASRRDGAAAEAALEALRNGIGAMSRLVEQLLTLSRAEPGSRRPRRDRVVLGALARQVLEAAAERALDAHVDLGLDERAPDAAVLGDATMLGEALANLVDNALRYCPAGSHVTVVVDGDGKEAVLRVEDDGPGIPPGEEERVFERFYRVIGTEGSGSGLGLAIVREVAETAGGTAAARPDPGRGFVVEMRLPAAPPA